MPSFSHKHLRCGSRLRQGRARKKRGTDSRGSFLRCGSCFRPGHARNKARCWLLRSLSAAGTACGEQDKGYAILWERSPPKAGMAELADAADSKSADRKV